MSLMDKYDLNELKNETEQFLLEELEVQLNGIPDEDVCKCQECVLDMACLSLNNLTPRYRVSLLGTLYTQVPDKRLSQDIQKVVSDVIQKISQNPSH